VLQRLMDALAFETQFSRWEALSDIRTALIGNRVAEMHGQSASEGVGLDLDVYLIRELYGRLRPGAVARAKQAGLSSQQAALRFLCTLGDEYQRAKGLAAPPERIVEFVYRVLPFDPEPGLVPEHWQRYAEAYRAELRKWGDEQRAAEPILSAARKEAAGMFTQNVATLGGGNVPTDLARLWAKLATAQTTTERELSRITGLTLATVAAWLWALKETGVVTVSGTALLEPRYYNRSLSTLSREAKEIRDRLDQTLDDQ
jgi:hypothetical protein